MIGLHLLLELITLYNIEIFHDGIDCDRAPGGAGVQLRKFFCDGFHINTGLCSKMYTFVRTKLKQ